MQCVSNYRIAVYCMKAGRMDPGNMSLGLHEGRILGTLCKVSVQLYVTQSADLGEALQVRPHPLPPWPLP